MIERLVGFDTTSHKSNLQLIEFVRDTLSELGVESVLVANETGNKANLFATAGPGGVPGILLSGHTDVVPVDGQDWHSDPFKVTRIEDRLHGRGTADMKSFISVILALFPEFIERGLKTPLHLAFSYDEEVGCVGVRRLLDHHISGLKVKPKACIVGEPTEMKVVTGHKGKRSLRCHVRGHECHSALAPSGVNAVEMAAEMVSFLRRMGVRFRGEGPFDPTFDPPHTTVHTGTIAGGTALNIVPRDCNFNYEIRHLPCDDAETLQEEFEIFARDSLLPDMHELDPDTGFRFEECSGFPGLDTPSDAAVTELAKTLSGTNATSKVSFGTEAGLFSKIGIPAVVCGPGSIRQAHRADEFITLEQVALCESFMRRLADRICHQ
jgi:acetylornithine deacetylase